MAEYIDRTAVRDRACAGCMWRTIHEDGPQGCSKTEPCEDLIAEFICAPAADVAPVVHGRWVWNSIENPLYRICNQCGAVYRIVEGDFPYNVCPNCEAKMRGEGP